MPNLTSLDLDNNLLSGSIPTELGRLPRLRDVSLLRNSGIRGRIPSELGLATSLRYLNCERTGLTGTIPSEL
jgi:Leucine-rich repeat (LRR) protein